MVRWLVRYTQNGGWLGAFYGTNGILSAGTEKALGGGWQLPRYDDPFDGLSKG